MEELSTTHRVLTIPLISLSTRIYHSLIIVEDLVPITTLPEGYLNIRAGGLILNNEKYDVAALYEKEARARPGFYPLPLLHTPKGRGSIRRTIQQDMERTHHSRHLVYVGDTAYPSLFDVILAGNTCHSRSPSYHLTTSAKLRQQGEEGKKVVEQIERIIELCRQG